MSDASENITLPTTSFVAVTNSSWRGCIPRIVFEILTVKNKYTYWVYIYKNMICAKELGGFFVNFVSEFCMYSTCYSDSVGKNVHVSFYQNKCLICGLFQGDF